MPQLARSRTFKRVRNGEAARARAPASLIQLACRMSTVRPTRWGQLARAAASSAPIPFALRSRTCRLVCWLPLLARRTTPVYSVGLGYLATQQRGAKIVAKAKRQTPDKDT